MEKDCPQTVSRSLKRDGRFWEVCRSPSDSDCAKLGGRSFNPTPRRDRWICGSRGSQKLALRAAARSKLPPNQQHNLPAAREGRPIISTTPRKSGANSQFAWLQVLATVVITFVRTVIDLVCTNRQGEATNRASDPTAFRRRIHASGILAAIAFPPTTGYA